jgi:hypothetical protein
MTFRLVTRGTIEERMMQVAKGKMVLEHLVVRKAGDTAHLKQSELDDILRWAAGVVGVVSGRGAVGWWWWCQDAWWGCWG